MRSSGLFSGLFVPDEVSAATSDRAWIQAMLDFEVALAAAEAETGVVPLEAAEAIAAAADASSIEPGALGVDARAAGNPVPALVRALTGAAGDEAGRWVHWGATSQDVMDTASMLVAKRALEPIDADLARAASACARLAEQHRDTPVAGRTLMQQALPTTFGLKAAGWLMGIRAARERLASVRLFAQFGGAAGTLASVGEEGPRIAGLLASRLELDEPPLPWHTMRFPVADLGAALAIAAGALDKVALDVVLLAQVEVGEVAEPADGGRGGSSTLPHKRNPVGSVLARACARDAEAAASVLLAAMAGEHERAAGAWHSEWPALTDALAFTGGAAGAMAEVLDGLEVHPERMAQNLDATGGLLMAESVSTAIARAGMGRLEAHDVVAEAAKRAVEAGRSLREELVDDERVTERLSEQEIDSALDPAAYLGAAGEFVDRAVQLQRREEGT